MPSAKQLPSQQACTTAFFLVFLQASQSGLRSLLDLIPVTLHPVSLHLFNASAASDNVHGVQCRSCIPFIYSYLSTLKCVGKRGALILLTRPGVYCRALLIGYVAPETRSYCCSPALLVRWLSSVYHVMILTEEGAAQLRPKLSKKERMRQKKAARIQERTGGSDDEDLGVTQGAAFGLVLGVPAACMCYFVKVG